MKYTSLENLYEYVALINQLVILNTLIKQSVISAKEFEAFYHKSSMNVFYPLQKFILYYSNKTVGE